MSELLRNTILAAERALAGDDDLGMHDSLASLLRDPGELESGSDEERMYLAGILEALNLPNMATLILGADGRPGQDNANAAFRNLEGMLAALHGDNDKARRMLRDALSAAGSPAMKAKILANLAAVSFKSGAVEEAEAWADAYTYGPARTAAADVLVASTHIDIAVARGGDLPALRAAVNALADACAARMAKLDTADPQALSLIAGLARGRILVATAENSVEDLDRATEALEVAAFRLAAEAGADDPRALAARSMLDSVHDGRLAISEGARTAGQLPATTGEMGQTADTGARMALSGTRRNLVRPILIQMGLRAAKRLAEIGRRAELPARTRRPAQDAAPLTDLLETADRTGQVNPLLQRLARREIERVSVRAPVACRRRDNL